MKKILFISEHFNVAGTETFMLNVIRASDKSKFHYDFLIFRPTKNKYYDEAKRLGCSFHVLCPRVKSPYRYLKELDSFFSKHEHDYDAVHWCGGAISSIAPLWFAHKYHVTNIICHSHSSSCSGLHTKLLHCFFRHMLPFCCTYFFACSTLAAKFFFGDRRATIIKNGIDLERYRCNIEIRNRYRKDLGIDSNDMVIGHVGRFEEVKNHSFLLEIFLKLLLTKPNAKLMLIGKGTLEIEMKDKVKRMGIDKNVRFLGERDDIGRCMQAMDCFVMPSLYEGLPFVLVEAQAAGLPCLISDTINDDAVITPYTIKKSLNENPERWCNDILCLTDNYKREDTGHYLVEKGFSIDDTVRYLENIYSNKRKP